MEAKYALILAGSIGAMTFLIGFFINAIYQNQLQSLIIPTAIIAILSWFGSGAQIIKLIKEYWEERKSRVKLDAEYDLDGNPHQYIARTEHEVTGYGKVKKRVLRIQVFNESDGVAENCKARFQLIQNENKEYPEHELKFLRWAYADVTELPIYAGGDESLNIVFSTDKKYMV